MLATERPELQNFIIYSRNKPRGQVVEELASWSLESRRIPDPYHFEVDPDGDLFSANASAKIKNIISRSNYIGWVEGQAFDAIEDYTRSHDEGTLMWVSPPHEGIYPSLKVIVSEIEKKGSSKRLFNRAMIFDFDADQSERFVQSLAEFSKNYPLRASLEDLRGTPLVLNSEESSWVSVLERIVNDEDQWEYIRTGKDITLKTAARLQADTVYQGFFDSTVDLADVKKQVIMMLGNKSSSCPIIFGTAFQVFFGNSLILGEGKKYPDFPCPNEKCDQIIESGKGITECPKCHAKKEDYANCG